MFAARRQTGTLFSCVTFVLSALVAFAVACGETRQPIGEECLIDSDCLSEICSDRVCVAAPTLVSGTEPSQPDDSPTIPDVDASSSVDAGTDARTDAADAADAADAEDGG